MIRVEAKRAEPTAKPAEPVPAAIVQRFDYSTLKPAQAKLARAAASFIAAQHDSMARSVLAIGARLAEVKAALGHGNFVAWVEASFPMSLRTAQNYMDASAKLGGKNETVSHLPVGTILELAKAPDDVRERVIADMAAAPVSHKHVKETLAEARQDAQRAKIEAKKSPQSRARAKRERERMLAEQRQMQNKRDAENAAVERALVEAASFLRSAIPADDRPRLAALLQAAKWTSVQTLAARMAGSLYGEELVAGTRIALTREVWEDRFSPTIPASAGATTVQP